MASDSTCVFTTRFLKYSSVFTVSEDYPGTGIGLAMVQKAMERMGGTVWAESELGVGAIFYLQLPLVSTGDR